LYAQQVDVSIDNMTGYDMNVYVYV